MLKFTVIEPQLRFPENDPAMLKRLEHDLVTENKASFYNGPAVYFLYQGDEVVYVGRTKTLLSRLGAHTRYKKFDSYSYIECGEWELDRLELVAIRKYKPRLNRK